MSLAEVIALVGVIGLLTPLALSFVAINRPRTKEEEDAKFKQDCEDFDKYMEDKRKDR